MTEKLTDGERAYLRRSMSHPSVLKALRIIDAQAAALDRVRAVLDGGVMLADQARLVREALAAAPEHTGPDEETVSLAYCQEFQRDLAAANTRVAELERINKGWEDHFGHVHWVDAVRAAELEVAILRSRVEELSLEKADERRIAGDAWNRIRQLEQSVYDQGIALDAANARADAAERKADVACDDARSFAEAANRAESERDEWKAKCEAAERENETLRNELVCRGDEVSAAEGGEHLQRLAVERTESEAAALRAVVRQRNDEVNHNAELARKAESRLSTATELLGRVNRAGSDPMIWRDIAAFLSTAPAPTEREAAERAVEHHCGVSGWRPDLGDAPCPACERATAAFAARQAVKS